MQRIPEPELMDSPDQAQAYADADFEEANTLFSDSIGAHFGTRLEGMALDLGCGPADIVCCLAHRYPGLHFYAVDGSAPMLVMGETVVAQHGLADRVTLLQRYLPCDDLPLTQYDLITSNSLLHHMHDPNDFWNMIVKFGRTDTRVLVMDLLRPQNEASAQALVEQYAADAPQVLRTDFYNSLFAAYRPDEIRAQLKQVGLDGLEVKVVSDRHWQVCGRLS